MHLRGSVAALLLVSVVAGLELRGQPPIVQNSPGQNTLQQSPPPQNEQEMSSHDSPATFSTKVNLVMVPVVVRNGNGKAIGTFQKEDFQLFDKGKPQMISRFSVEKAGKAVIPAEAASDDALFDKSAAPTSPALSIAQRFVMYVFDDGPHQHAGFGASSQRRRSSFD